MIALFRAQLDLLCAVDLGLPAAQFVQAFGDCGEHRRVLAIPDRANRVSLAVSQCVPRFRFWLRVCVPPRRHGFSSSMAEVYNSIHFSSGLSLMMTTY